MAKRKRVRDTKEERGVSKDFNPDAIAVGKGVPYIPIARQEELIIRRYLDDGLSPAEISKRCKINIEVVRSVIKRAQLRRKADGIKEDIKDKLFLKKVPIMEAIADRGLIGLLEWMEELITSGAHLEMGVDGAQRLANVIEKLHGMYRLELGKSNQNVAVAIEHSSKTMEQILAQLSKPPEEGGDPFVEYPSVSVELPAIEDKSSNRVEVQMPKRDAVKTG